MAADADGMNVVETHEDSFHALDVHGYVLLRNAIPEAWLVPLRSAFDAGVIASAEWPVPRGHDWSHSCLDLDPHVQSVCRLPALLAGVGQVLGMPFFLSQVEGREPCANNVPQPLHRDGEESPRQVMAAMAWLDDYGVHNGATQLVPGSHRMDHAGNAIIIEGQAGDLLLFDPDVIHGATSNVSGKLRRSLLISYTVESLREQYRQTEALRNVRMDTSEIFH
jgi:Phytanoyl-CoA dioxygenase (PhyH)